jgi:uncharacterized membrane protein YkoI
MKRTSTIVSVAALVTALAGAGVAYALAQDDGDPSVGEPQHQQASEAALAATGGGTVTEVERDDDAAGGYDVEIRLDDGTEVDVDLDRAFAVVRTEPDDDADGDDADADDADDADDRDDRDDAPVPDADRQRAADAALAETGGGTVVDVEHDDAGEGYEVEVLLDDGRDVDVHLDARFRVTGTDPD